jgi:S1/P1 Nuclease
MATSLLSVFTCEWAYPRRLLLCVAVLLIAPQGAMAFGAKAHRIAGEIAELYLCEDARTELERIAPGSSLAEAGLWADRIRSLAAWDKARTWHYINVPDGMTLSQTPRLSSGDVLTAINRFEAELGDPALSDLKRRQAYFFLVHFIADVHQPLHVGKLRDRGGNSVDVRVNDKLTTLHQYWDAEVLDSVQASPKDYAAEIAARYDAIAWQWQAFAPELWAIESLAFRPEVYDFGEQDWTGGRVTLDEAYQTRALQITEFRLAQAGIRLASTLNRIWCWGESDA